MGDGSSLQHLIARNVTTSFSEQGGEVLVGGEEVPREVDGVQPAGAERDVLLRGEDKVEVGVLADAGEETCDERRLAVLGHGERRPGLGERRLGVDDKALRVRRRGGRPG